MKVQQWWLTLVLIASLGVAAAALVARVADHARGARLELAQVKLTVVDESIQEQLKSLDDQVFITYYVSQRLQMPSHLRRLERDVIDVLDAMAGASGGRLKYQVIDPDEDEAAAKRAARRRAAPTRVRTVLRDGHSEREVWSSLVIAYGPRPVAVLNGIGEEQLRHLQSLIVAQLDQMAEPERPVIALAAPATHTAARATLRAFGDVVEVDLAPGGPPIPSDADLLFWIDPGEADAARFREIDHFISRGGGLVVAGSTWRAATSLESGSPLVRFERSDGGLEAVLARYGLKPVRGLVLDSLMDAIDVAGTAHQAPFIVRCISPNQDFSRMRRELGASISFATPTPVVPDGTRLAEDGWTFETLGSTSENARLIEVPERPIPLAQDDWDTLEHAEAAPKLPLMAMLRPHDPWRGSIVFLASSTPFGDSTDARPGNANQRLIGIIIDTLASEQRLVAMQAARERAGPPLPELDATQRLWWRIGAIGTLPLLLLAIAVVRGALRMPRRSDRIARRLARPALWQRRTAVGATVGLGVLCIGVISTSLGSFAWHADLTTDGVNRLAGESIAIARSATRAAPVHVELIFSDHGRLPPRMRQPVAHAEQLLDELRRAGAHLDIVRVHPDDVSEAEKAALAASGITPFEVINRDEERTRVRSVYSYLQLRHGERREVLSLPTEAAFENLEFRLAFALWRLENGRKPHVALASDVPRLTPAEAHEFYQQQGLIAPRGSDVYSLARQLLVQHDFRVTHVNPQAPQIPNDADLLVWFQPRRPMTQMMEEVARFLHSGRPALVAAQHFNMQARQYAGRGNSTVYWPQPQWPELHTNYLPQLGVHMDRVVLFDDLMTVARAESQVHRGSRREFDQQESSLPFLIRAVAANFATDSNLTRGLGDQLFKWGSYFRLDKRRLRDMDLAAKMLITTSPRTWSFAWEGGFLPEEVLKGPLPDETERIEYLGRLPLATMIEGVFPLWNPPPPPPPPTFEETAPPAPEQEPYEPLDLDSLANGSRTRLLLIGGSELFKDDQLLDEEFRADQLLLNSVATLALDTDLASIATKRPVSRGFDYVDPSHRLRWRIVVIGAVPALTMLVWIGSAVTRRRSPSPIAAQPRISSTAAGTKGES